KRTGREVAGPGARGIGCVRAVPGQEGVRDGLPASAGERQRSPADRHDGGIVQEQQLRPSGRVRGRRGVLHSRMSAHGGTTMQHGIRAGATALAVMLAAVLTGCSGGSGASVEELPGSGGGTSGATYNGPPPSTPDVQAFKMSRYDHGRASSRCGACHGLDGGESPLFARPDDVNLAYAEVSSFVNLTSPADSPMVLKVAGGHNCWLTSDEACADILETWIRNWAGELATGGREITLEPPPLRDPGQSKSFPAD